VTSSQPLFPATAEERARRLDAMRHLLSDIAKARASGRHAIAAATLDALEASFSVPVAISIDWDAVDLGHPIILIRHERPDAVLPALSLRQREVATLISLGQSNNEIAERLGISLATVKDHVHHILKRLGLRSRSALAAAMRR
jgi:two-component system, NarL family, nitrate/nitrite response regulator NarL